MKQWYEILFQNSAEKYDQERFTQGTVGECDFLEKELQYNKDLKILDVGCGTGRHTIELTKRGYRVTGIDLSEAQLKRAQQKAVVENLEINFLQGNARNLPFKNEFDIAIMLCEGGFPLMETDEMNFAILQSVTKALTKNGKLIFTTLNGLFPLHHSTQKFLSSKAEGQTQFQDHQFDLMTFREKSIVEFEDDEGNKTKVACDERYYVPSEITWLLKSLGYQTIDIFGAKLGQFSRTDTLTTEDFEMLVIADK